MNFKSKPIILASIIVIATVIIAAAGFWFLQKNDKSKGESTVQSPRALQIQETISLTDAKDTLGGQILGKTQNPLEGKLPPTNPFEKTETNPLKDVYKNPLE